MAVEIDEQGCQLAVVIGLDRVRERRRRDRRPG